MIADIIVVGMSSNHSMINDVSPELLTQILEFHKF